MRYSYLKIRASKPPSTAYAWLLRTNQNNRWMLDRILTDIQPAHASADKRVMRSVIVALLFISPLAQADSLLSCLLSQLRPRSAPVSAPKTQAPQLALGAQEKIWALRLEGRSTDADQATRELAHTLANAPTAGARYAGSGIHQALRAGLVGQPGIEVILKSQNAKMEVAAYRIDHMLGRNRVPLTVLRADGGGSPVSAQVFVASERSARPNEMGPTLYDGDLRAFDFLIQNTDRNNTNILVRHDGSIVAIDHEAAVFRSVYGIDHFFPWQNQKPTPGMLEALRRLNLDELRAELGDLLNETQLTSLLRRRDQLIQKFGP